MECEERGKKVWTEPMLEFFIKSVSDSAPQHEAITTSSELLEGFYPHPLAINHSPPPGISCLFCIQSCHLIFHTFMSASLLSSYRA